MKEYIEREAAVDELMPIYKSASFRNRNVFSTARKCLEAIEAIPAADVEVVRHGRWVNNDDGYGCEDLWWCSACKEEFVLIEGTPHDNGYHYCPNCGAKMDGGVNDEQRVH